MRDTFDYTLALLP